MQCALRNGWAWGVVGLLIPTLLLAVEPTRTNKKANRAASAANASPPENVELFAALDAKKVVVRFVPYNAEAARIFVVNATKKPLIVELPKVFAARPILAQFQVPGGGQGTGSTASTGLLSSGGQTPQILAGTQPSNRSQIGGPGPGVFNIPPGKTVDVRVPVMCLQYGNPDPRPDIPYELVKLDSVLKKPELKAMLEEFAAGKFEQPVAQLAAWHYSNGLDMNQLASTGFAPGRLTEVAHVIQHIHDKMKAESTAAATKAAATKNTATKSAGDAPSAASSSQP